VPDVCWLDPWFDWLAVSLHITQPVNQYRSSWTWGSAAHGGVRKRYSTDSAWAGRGSTILICVSLVASPVHRGGCQKSFSRLWECSKLLHFTYLMTASLFFTLIVMLPPPVGFRRFIVSAVAPQDRSKRGEGKRCYRAMRWPQAPKTSINQQGPSSRLRQY
jgi:hypothetical protein